VAAASLRGVVDASVRPADTEKASCCCTLAYGPMAKMEAADVERQGWDAAGDAGTTDMVGWGAGWARAQELRGWGSLLRPRYHPKDRYPIRTCPRH
jgi:hypothetical protein